jgi:hypothetical protein
MSDKNDQTRLSSWKEEFAAAEAALNTRDSDESSDLLDDELQDEELSALEAEVEEGLREFLNSDDSGATAEGESPVQVELPPYDLGKPFSDKRKRTIEGSQDARKGRAKTRKTLASAATSALLTAHEDAKKIDGIGLLMAATVVSLRAFQQSNPNTDPSHKKTAKKILRIQAAFQQRPGFLKKPPKDNRRVTTPLEAEPVEA